MNKETKSAGRFSDACKKSLVQITRAKKAVLAQFRDLAAGHEQILRLALNEAEALAWQTQYPYLVFQDLAEEKAQTVARWIEHQRLVLASSGLS